MATVGKVSKGKRVTDKRTNHELFTSPCARAFDSHSDTLIAIESRASHSTRVTRPPFTAILFNFVPTATVVVSSIPRLKGKLTYWMVCWVPLPLTNAAGF